MKNSILEPKFDYIFREPTTPESIVPIEQFLCCRNTPPQTKRSPEPPFTHSWENNIHD